MVRVLGAARARAAWRRGGQAVHAGCRRLLPHTSDPLWDAVVFLFLCPPDGASVDRDGGHAPPSSHTPFPPRPSPLDACHTRNEINWKVCDGQEPRDRRDSYVRSGQMFLKRPGVVCLTLRRLIKKQFFCTAQGAPRPPPALAEDDGCLGKPSRSGEATGSDGVVGETPDVSGSGCFHTTPTARRKRLAGRPVALHQHLPPNTAASATTFPVAGVTGTHMGFRDLTRRQNVLQLPEDAEAARNTREEKERGRGASNTLRRWLTYRVRRPMTRRVLAGHLDNNTRTHAHTSAFASMLLF